MEIIEQKNFAEFMNLIKNRFNDGNYLFRGQSNSEWKLETTLERDFAKNMTLFDYYAIMFRTKPMLETFSGKKWDLPEPYEYTEWLKKVKGASINFDTGFNSSNKFSHFFGYEYMSHLRHTGFPTPLLDWSRSPFVAAFFAFRHAKLDPVSIFVYNEMPQGHKSGGSGTPSIHKLTFPPLGNKRHYHQQSCYTVCCMLQPPADVAQSYFMEHEAVFSEGNNNQDATWKIILPATEKLLVMKHLSQYNLNAHSLFGSEESLCESIASLEWMRYVEKGKRLG